MYLIMWLSTTLYKHIGSGDTAPLGTRYACYSGRAKSAMLHEHFLAFFFSGTNAFWIHTVSETSITSDSALKRMKIGYYAVDQQAPKYSALRSPFLRIWIMRIWNGAI
jgi:hypothetical protein